MRILFAATELPLASGITAFVENVAAELRGLGHTVDVVDVSRVERVEGVEEYDIVHLHGIWRPLLHQIAKKATRGRLVWSTHGMTAPWSMKHKWWKKWLYWRLVQRPDLRRAAVVHATVEKEAEWNRALGLGVGGRSRAIVVPLGTHLPERAEDGNLTQRRRGAEEGRILLFVGRIYPVKAIDRLIAAFAEAGVAGWKLRIVGPDQAGHLDELKALVAKLKARGLVCAVEFVGPKFEAELQAEYELCDMLALVSHTENFGATVVDAMAHGKPVITSTATPWREVTEAQVRCGWWVDNDVESLTAALRTALTTSAEELRAMGARGRALVEAKYTWAAVARQLSAVYEAVRDESREER